MGILAKAFLYLGLYVFLHFGYDATGFDVLRPIAGVSESVFEHLKIGFFAYFFASLLEFVILRRRSFRPRGFWPSRMLATWSIPWTIVSLWYLAQSTKPLPLSLELVWAFSVTLLSGISGGILEREVEETWFSPRAKGVLFILFLVSCAFFATFTYRTPPVDLFATPSPSHTLVGQ